MALNTINLTLTQQYSSPILYHVNWDSKILINFPLKRGHLSFKVIISLQKGQPYSRGIFCVPVVIMTEKYSVKIYVFGISWIWYCYHLRWLKRKIWSDQVANFITDYSSTPGAVVVVMLDLWLPKQSVPITTKVVSSNPTHGEVYSIQHYVIKLVTLATGQWFSPSTPVSSTNKIDHHNITEILLKVALNTITLTVTCVDYFITDHSSTPLIGGLRGSNVLLFIGSGKRVDLFHISLMKSIDKYFVVLHYFYCS